VNTIFPQMSKNVAEIKNERRSRRGNKRLDDRRLSRGREEMFEGWEAEEMEGKED
jgi:hypothetical protein